MKRFLTISFAVLMSSIVMAQIDDFEDLENKFGSKRKPKNPFNDTLTVVENNLNPTMHMASVVIGFGGNDRNGIQIFTNLQYEFFNPKFSLNATLGGSVPIQPAEVPDVNTVYESRWPWTFGFGGSYYFKAKEVDHEYLILTHMIARSRRKSYWEGDDVMGKALWRYGLDLGYSVGLDYFDMSFGDYIGTTSTGEEFGSDQNGIGGDDAQTYYRYNILRAGISFTKVGRIKVHSAKHNKICGDEVGFRLYTHALIGFGFKTDDVFMQVYDGMTIDGVTYNSTLDPGPYYVRLDMNPNLPKFPFGGAFGIQSMSYGGFGANAGAEVGILPGVSTRSNLFTATYLRLFMGFRIGWVMNEELPLGEIKPAY